MGSDSRQAGSAEQPADDRRPTDPSAPAEGSGRPDRADRAPTDPSGTNPPSGSRRAKTKVGRKRPDETSGAGRRPAQDEHVGKLLTGKYRIDKLIAKGGMGRVYRATQFPLERSVAIKILNEEYQRSDPQFVKRFFLEAAIAAKLSHPHTITVFDYGEGEEGELYIAMELLKGRSLSRVIARDGPYDAATTARLAMQICRALREAHDAGIIHRDLKPGNIFILDDGEHPFAKVLDFGLVKLFVPENASPDDEQSALGPLEGELTRTGTLLGSPKYMSPEQIHGQPLDPRTDIYSLGVILFQMLTGHAPFTGATGVDVIYKHVNHAVPSMKSMNAEVDVPPELEEIVRRCLEKSRDKRYSSMDELLAYLKEALATFGNPSGSVSGLRPDARGPSQLEEAAFSGADAPEEPTPTGLRSAGSAVSPDAAMGTRWPVVLAGLGFVVALGTLVYVVSTLPAGRNALPPAPPPPEAPAIADDVEPPPLVAPPPVVEAPPPPEAPPPAKVEPQAPDTPEVEATAPVEDDDAGGNKRKKKARRRVVRSAKDRPAKDTDTTEVEADSEDAGPTFRDNPY